MDAKQFYNEVKEMRRLQRLYFKTRNREVMRKAQKIEQVIDDEIERVEKIINRKTDRSLF